MRDRSREKTRTRPSPTQRGYGNTHRELRKQWDGRVKRGGVSCVRCGYAIHPSALWYLGHDHVNGGYLGPEHAKCGVAERNKRCATKRIAKHSQVW